jgi:23S rRNA (guanine745-N1)-methyltransferase
MNENLPLACPLDGLPLQKQQNSMVCANGHCFDFDRKGTLNLLPVQFKKSLEPGDSKEMVLARQIFLDSGAYQPVADMLCDLVKEFSGPENVIVDAGCGEGYYTAQLVPFGSVIGLDISKYAIQAAVKRSHDVMWIVGTNKKIPVQDHSVDIVVCLFGFPVWDEFQRVLKPNGVVIMADPGPQHLIELRRNLYPQISEKAAMDKESGGFSLRAQRHLLQQIAPPAPEMLSAQIMMTPHNFRALPENKQAAIDAVYTAMTLDVVFSVWKC